MRFPQVSDRVKEAPAQALRGVFAGIGQLLLLTDKLKNKDKAGPPQQLPRSHTRQALATAPPAATPAPPADTPAPPADTPAPPADTPAPPATTAAPPADAASAGPGTAALAARTPPAIRDLPRPAEGEVSAVPEERAPAEGSTPGDSGGGAPAAAAAPSAPEATDLDRAGNVRLLTSAEAEAPSSGPAAEQEAATPEAGLPLANYDQLTLASLRGRLRTLDVTQLRHLVSYEREHAARADVLAMFERRITKLETGA